MTEPTTEAGRRLLKALGAAHDGTVAAAILIIEAEAREGVTLTREPERNSNPGTADVWYTPDCGHVHLSTDGTIYAVCPEGVTLTREPGLLREAVRCWLAGDTKGLNGAMTDLAATVTAPQYTEDDPDWSAMVTPEPT